MEEEVPPLTAIGLRVYSNKQVFFTVIQKENDESITYLEIGSIYVPLMLNAPERLNYVRNTALDIMIEYNVRCAAIRLQEFNTRQRLNSLSIERYNLEGVLQESLASCAVEEFIAGQISVLSKLAGIERTAFKELVAGDIDFEGYAGPKPWSRLIEEERESALAAVAALNLK